LVFVQMSRRRQPGLEESWLLVQDKKSFVKQTVDLKEEKNDPKRLEKFIKILNEKTTNIVELKRLSLGGIPETVRALTWQLLLGYSFSLSFSLYLSIYLCISLSLFPVLSLSPTLFNTPTCKYQIKAINLLFLYLFNSCSFFLLRLCISIYLVLILFLHIYIYIYIYMFIH